MVGQTHHVFLRFRIYAHRARLYLGVHHVNPVTVLFFLGYSSMNDYVGTQHGAGMGPQVYSPVDAVPLSRF